MSYLLIGNISALICEECMEPLADARIRIYLPEGPHDPDVLARGIFKDLRQIPGTQVRAKADRLLAEAELDGSGNFCLSWDEIHLFTEPLELDICLNSVPGARNAREGRAQYHLSTFVPHWKRDRDKYLAAFAYVVPAEKWSNIRREFGAWAVAGTVRHADTGEALRTVRVEAYNALNDKLLGCGYTNELGKYQLYFSRDMLSGSRLIQIIRESRYEINDSPDVYFKIFDRGEPVLEEDGSQAHKPGRRRIAHCSRQNLQARPATQPRKTGTFSGWINGFISGKARSQHKDRYVTY
ncbi:hypothetical protein [Chitinophaga sp.]|uniref:hypothetical protein n=1 Tax=Chitinophaga sp. TaxID=1869181 RepID=UPI0026072806|nr:hypothetical protein [uncultured Chitinophaga sp.]